MNCSGARMLLVLILGMIEFTIITLSILQCSKSKKDPPVVQELPKAKSLSVEKTQNTAPAHETKIVFDIKKTSKDDEKPKTELDSLRDEQYPFQKVVERKEKEKEKIEIEGKVEQHFSKAGEKEKDLSVYSMDIKHLKKREQAKFAETAKQTPKEGPKAETAKQTPKEGKLGSAEAERKASQEKRGGVLEGKGSSAEAMKKEGSSQERKTTTSEDRRLMKKEPSAAT